MVSITIGSAYYLNTPTYGVLFSDMDSDTASSLVTKLKTAKVDYVLDDGGKTIRVPTNRVNDLRLQFAADGMPGSGNVGFGIFDKVSFGVTDFVERVNYQRALEGELTRTISSLSEVSAARVHLAIPPPALFTGREQPTKASVTLKLRSSRQLSAATVNGITGIVSASVPQLRRQDVVIVDGSGRPLTKSDAESDTDGISLERQQRIERDLAAKVVTQLEPVVGLGRIRVNISATLNSVSAVTNKRVLDPATVIVSSQSSTQMTGGAGSGMAGGVGGVAGAQANLPPDPDKPAPPAPLPIGGALASSQSDVKQNNEFGEEKTTSQRPAGDIERLTVSVLVDDARDPAAVQTGQPAAASVKPRTPEEIEKIQKLVADAVGLDTERGDHMTVENISFEQIPVEEPVAATAMEKYGPQGMEALRVVGIVLLVVAAIFGVIRPMVTGSLGPSLPAVKGALGAGTAVAAAIAGGAGARTVQDLEAEMDAQLTTPGALKMPVLTRRMAALTQKEPENAARLLRTWLNEEQ